MPLWLPEMKSMSRFISISIIALLLGSSHGFAADFPQQSRVLVIFGNPDIGPWEQNFNQIILKELATQAAIPVIPEFLDLIQTAPSDQQLLAESLNLKYSRLTIDLVIAVLPEANSFVFEWAEVFAPDADILHVVPGLDVSQAEKQLSNSQIIETSLAATTAKTLQLIPQLFPDVSHLYLVGGSSEGDLSYLQRFENALQEIDPVMGYTVLSGLTPEELQSELATADPDSAIMLSTYDRDRRGEPMRTMAVNTMLSESTALPIFSVFDTLVTSGTLGGNVSSSTQYANTAARVAIQMLAGQRTSRPLFSDTAYLFDGQLLDRFGVNRNLLPSGSIIINDSPDLWRDYSGWIISGLFVFAVQLALIAGLIAAIQRRRRAEVKLKQIRKMEALGSLSGGIAHDFNNILMSIMANAELLNMKSSDPEFVKTKVANILSASDRAKDLIGQILSFSRQTANFKPRPVSVDEVLLTTIERLRAFLPENCQIQYDSQEKLPIIKGDESQLEQIFTNICVNAAHAMPDGGDIHIRAMHCHLDKPLQSLVKQIPGGEYLCVKIQDSGQGISSEDLQHVFEPFFTTKPRGRGTGLGLAMVYQMVKAHGAYIHLESEVGKGTTALLYFPCTADTGYEKPEQHQELLHHGNGERILLVDDDEMVLDASSQTLKALGYKVHSFNSSAAALTAFTAQPDHYDVVLSDLSMPEMDGIRLISAIRELHPEIPAIICTGYSDSTANLTMENLGILRKPSSTAEISRTLSKVLQGQNSSGLL